MRSVSLAAALCAASLSPLAHAAWTPDTGYNGNGRSQDYLDLGTRYADHFADVAMSPGGAYYSVGRADLGAANGPTVGVVFKRLANGSKDLPWGAGNSRMAVSSEASNGSAALTAVAYDGAGTGAVLAAGFNDLANGKRCGVIYRFKETGAYPGVPDQAFANGGRFEYCAGDATRHEFTDIKVLADGRLLVSGIGKPASGEVVAFLLRVTATGQLDSTFNGNGRASIDIRPGKDDTALRIAVGAQGYYVAGDSIFTRSVDFLRGDNADLWVARVLPNGALDTGFNGNGKRIEAIDVAFSDKQDRLADLALDGAGRVLLLANVNPMHVHYDPFTNVDYTRMWKSRAQLIRLTTTGARDTTFNGVGHVEMNAGVGPCNVEFCAYDEPAALVALPDHRVLVAGRFVPSDDWNGEAGASLSITQVAANGSSVVTERFAPPYRNEGKAMLRQPDGKIVIGGLVRTVGMTSDTDFALWRYLAP